MADTYLTELQWRGLIHDQTPQLADRRARGAITAYAGFDPTAPSLQLGNVVPIMLLAHLQRAGGTPVVVVGGGTGLIGDPSGKRAERPLLDAATVEENVERQRAQFAKFLEFGTGPGAATLVDNAAWLDSIDLVGFLRDTGKHFTISTMLQKESIKSRLEDGISYTEFSYMLLQAYDFLHLYRHHGCELQVGGSDQWGNITAGIDLIRRVEGGEAHGLSAPLVTTAGGTKFGKTEEGTVWLDPERTSPYRFYQFWINQDDRDVADYLRLFTFETQDTVDDLLARHEHDAGARIPHRALAADVTARVHGPAAATGAEQASRVLFGELDPSGADLATWEMLAGELPCSHLDLAEPVGAVDAVVASGLAGSKGEARRLLAQRGVSMNGRPLADDDAVDGAQLLAGRYLWLRRGKKTDALLDARAP
jgi:tyrosyl-tRNA synthetase